METKALDEKFTQTELGTVKDELTRLEHDKKIKDDRIRHLEESMKRLQQNYEAVSKILSLNASPEEVEAALKRKMRPLARMTKSGGPPG